MLYRFRFGFLTLMKLICFRYLLSLPGKNEYAKKKRREVWILHAFFSKIYPSIPRSEPSAELECPRNSWDFDCFWWGKQQLAEILPPSPPQQDAHCEHFLEKRVGSFSWLWHSFKVLSFGNRDFQKKKVKFLGGFILNYLYLKCFY